jgi:iron complex transport system permease protein
MKKVSSILPLVALAAAALALFLADLAIGSVHIPLAGVIQSLENRSPDPVWKSIVLVFRLPKAITAALAGGALAVSGLILQTVFRNPLAGPDSLGIGAGASIGVALVVLAAGSTGGAAFLAGLGSAGYSALALAASAGAFAVLFLILIVARRVENSVTLLIIGLLIGYLAGSLVSLLVYSGSPQKVQVYLGWTYGSFSAVTADQLPVLGGAIAIGYALTLGATKPLNALLLGERFAETLGVRVKGARYRALTAAAILAGAVTAFCGPVAFLGIAAPQAARRVFRSSDHAVLIPGAALVGAVLALAADIVSQAPGQGSVLPLNPILALVGAPIILSLFIRGSRAQGSRDRGSRAQGNVP